MPLPKELKFVKTKQEYIPVIDCGCTFDDKNRSASSRDNQTPFKLVTSLTQGGLVLCNNILYTALEVRKLGVVVKKSYEHDVMMYKWCCVSAAKLTKNIVNRLGFMRQGFTVEHCKKKHILYSKYHKGLPIHISLYGVLIIGDVLVPGRVGFAHQLQYLLNLVYEDNYQASLRPRGMAASTNRQVCKQKEGYITGFNIFKKDRFEQGYANCEYYKAHEEVKHFVKRTVITPEGEEEIVRGKGRYPYMAPVDKQFIEDNPTYFEDEKLKDIYKWSLDNF
jgi:hypothetical protein